MAISGTSYHKEARMIRLLCVFACVTIMAVMGSCTAGMERLDADYGTSYKLAKVNQMLHPDAERNLAPVYGMSGIAAGNVMEKYNKGFEAPKTAAPTYTIPIGSIPTGQMGQY